MKWFIFYKKKNETFSWSNGLIMCHMNCYRSLILLWKRISNYFFSLYLVTIDLTNILKKKIIRNIFIALILLMMFWNIKFNKNYLIGRNLLEKKVLTTLLIYLNGSVIWVGYRSMTNCYKFCTRICLFIKIWHQMVSI